MPSIKFILFFTFIISLLFYHINCTCSNVSQSQCGGLCYWEKFAGQCVDYPCLGRSTCDCIDGCIMQGSTCVNDPCLNYNTLSTCVANGCFPDFILLSFTCQGPSLCNSYQKLSDCLNDITCTASSINYTNLFCRAPYTAYFCNQYSTFSFQCFQQGCYPKNQQCKPTWG